MSKLEAQQQAIRMAVSQLAGVDMSSRCKLLGLPAPVDGKLNFRMLGQDIVLAMDSFELTAANGKSVKPGDQILVLHYLQCDTPIVPMGELITFRDMPGGQFYWNPFLSRSINPLVCRIGNDLDLLNRQLARFDCQPCAAGDLGARIHAIGNLYATLVYHRGDDEFGPAAEILFDSCIKRVYCAEDVAFVASRICLGLL